MLHLDLVNKDILASSLDEAVEEERARDGAEKEHIEEDEEQEESFEVLRNGEGQELIIRKWVVATRDVHDEDHVAKTWVIVCECICDCVIRNLYEYISHQGK